MSCSVLEPRLQATRQVTSTHQPAFRCFSEGLISSRLFVSGAWQLEWAIKRPLAVA